MRSVTALRITHTRQRPRRSRDRISKAHIRREHSHFLEVQWMPSGELHRLVPCGAQQSIIALRGYEPDAWRQLVGCIRVLADDHEGRSLDVPRIGKKRRQTS